MKPSNVGKTVDPLLWADEIEGIDNRNFGCCIWKTVILLLEELMKSIEVMIKNFNQQSVVKQTQIDK